MATFNSTLQSYDFAIDGAASSATFTVPNGHTIGWYMCDALVPQTTNCLLLMRAVVGGTPDSGAAAYVSTHNFQGVSFSRRLTSFLCGCQTELSNSTEPITARGQLFGLRTAGMQLFTMGDTNHYAITTNAQAHGGRRVATTAVTGVQFLNSIGETFTAGKIWFMTYKRKATVQTLTVPGAASTHELPAIAARNEFAVITGDVVTSGNTSIELQPYDGDTAAWPLTGEISKTIIYSAGDSTGLSSIGAPGFYLMQSSGTIQSFATMLFNMNGTGPRVAQPWSANNRVDVDVGNGARTGHGLSLLDGKKTLLRLASTLTPTIDSGLVYLTTFRM